MAGRIEMKRIELKRNLVVVSVLAATAARGEVDFVHEVVPILREHCGECHAGEEAKGGFSINTRALFLDKGAAVPGDAAESLFLELIEDDDPDFQMPPPKKARVPVAAVAVLRSWIDEGMAWEPGFAFAAPAYEPPLQPRRPELPSAVAGRENPIDRFLDTYLADGGLPSPVPGDDATFLRRVHLDLVGLPPTAGEVRAFLADGATDKRSNLVEALLARDLDYADHWLTFWNDLLRNDYAGTGFITGGRSQVSRWLYDALKQNRPFDEMVRELVAPPTAESEGFIKGIEWRGDVSAGQTLPIQFAQSLGQSFLGINLKCASCHDSFVDRWTLGEAYGLAAVYADAPLQVHRCDKPTGETARASWLFPEIGQVDPDAARGERLAQLAGLMTHPENGRVPRTIVNRLWAQLMGRGIVHPLDAIQTEPWHEDLLDWLAADFQDHGYDLRRTLGLVAASSAYGSRSESEDDEDEGGDYAYGGPRSKRLTAEQFVDQMWAFSGTAPEAFDAPVVRGMSDPETAARLARPSSWIWGPSAAEGPVAAGERVLLRRDFAVDRSVLSAGVVATVDNEFVLYLNDQPVLRGSDWSRLESGPATVRQGKNRILIAATNAGSSPNPAGAFAMLRIVYADGGEEIVATGPDWTAADKVPAGEKPAQWKLGEMAWKPVVAVSLAPWSAAIDPQVGETLAACSVGEPLMVRASLVKADFLMRSLGRPNRDQIVTSRPAALTTLEAIDLANDEGVASALEAGSAKLLEVHGEDPARLVEEVYLSTLSRFPSEEESTLLREVLGERPGVHDVADLVWSLWMTPEYLLVR